MRIFNSLGIQKGASGSQGVPGSPGTPGTNGTNGAPGSVWREGTGVPSNGLGIDGDFYLDGATGNVYQRISAAYVLQCNIQGPIGTGGNVTADTHPNAPTAWDDEFESGSSINLSKWTAFGLSTGSAPVAQGALAFNPALTASRNWGGYTQAAPGTPFAMTAKLVQFNPAVNSLSGLFFATASGAAGKIVVFGWNGTTLIVQRLTNNTTFSANVFTSNTQVSPAFSQFQMLYLQIAYDGTNLNFSVSLTGLARSFVQVYTETAAAFLGGAPTLIGIGADNESATTQSVLFVDWHRRTT